MNGAVSESPKRRGVATIMICFCVITEGAFPARSVDELGSRLSFGRPAPLTSRKPNEQVRWLILGVATPLSHLPLGQEIESEKTSNHDTTVPFTLNKTC